MFETARRLFNSAISEGDYLSSLPDSTSPGESLSPEQLQCQKLEAEIVSLWREVWFGLYQRHDSHGPYHVDRVHELWAGAGMFAFEAIKTHEDRHHDGPGYKKLGLLGLALRRKGVNQLRLFDGLDSGSLELVIQLLEAYKREIAALGEIYNVLRSLQVGFGTPTEDDKKAVEQQYNPLAEQLAKRLLHLDARLHVLDSELQDKTWEKFGPSSERYGWYVESRVLDNQRGSKRKHKFGTGVLTGSTKF